MTDEKGLVSIVVPCCGQLEQTRLSVPRVLKHSRQPFEVLFIDGGSLDGTKEYLEGVAAAAPVRVEVLRGNRDSSFTKLVEEAVGRARGAFVAWVNNDVLVPELWLQQLTALVGANDKIGVAGPVTNLAEDPQQVTSVPYRLMRPKGQTGGALLDTQEVDHFARGLREASGGQWVEVSKLGGFCWLAKRTMFRAPQGVEFVVERGADGLLIGRRFSLRARQGATQLACCRTLFVHQL